MAIWQPLPRGSEIRRANNFGDGVDTGNNAFFVSENAYVDGYGWDFDLYPSLSTRKGRTAFGASSGSHIRLLTNYGNKHLVRASNGTLQYWNGSAWTNISGSFNASANWDSTNFDINGPALILTNGVDSPRYWNGSTLSTLSGAPIGKYIASDNRRVYIAKDDEIHYCAFQDALDWSSAENSGIVEYYTPNGGDLTGLKAFEGQIWAFKKDAYALIFHTGDARVTHRLVEGSNDIGCDAYKTIVEVGPYLFFKGPNDVYMGAGGAAMGIGDPRIKRILESVNQSALDACCAWTDGHRYYLCLPTGSNTVPDTEIVYHIEFKKWHIRNKSLGGMVYGAQLNDVPYGAWSNGMVYRLNDGVTDNGAAIPYSVTTRPYDEGQREAEKEYYEMKIQGFLSETSSMSIQISADDRGDSFMTIDSMSGAEVSQNKNIIVPMDTVPITNWMRYRLEGSGYVEINEVQRFARIQPLQH